MKPTASIALGVLLAVTLTSRGVVGAPAVAPHVHKGDGWAVAAPADWRVFAGVRPPIVLHLVGDDRAGVPQFDGTLSPLKAGLQVEVFPKGSMDLAARTARDLKELKDSGAFEPLEEPRLKEVKLADGTPAWVLDAEFVRLQNGRVSFNSKVYCADAAGRHVVASAFVTCGRPGRRSVKTIALPDFVRAQAMSLVLDPEKLDAAALKAAYDKHTWTAAAAMAQARTGNDLLERDKFADAATAFRDALTGWEHLPTAHNGLAWALLHGQGAGREQFEEAVREARAAVEETEGLDYSALDTLALAYHRNGDKEKAVETIQRALKLRPDHPELRARLKSFE